jgi:acetyl esterase/lipase
MNKQNILTARGRRAQIRGRIAFAAANAIDRRTGRLTVGAIDRLLPVLMAAGMGRGYRAYWNVPYVSRGKHVLHVDIICPTTPGPHPVVVGFHGGAWVIGRKENLRHVGAYLARRSYVTVLVQYRLATQAPFPAATDDVATSLEWVRDHIGVYGGDSQRVGVFGDSAGGHLSAWAAVSVAGRDPQRYPPIRAAVHWYGVFDFAKFARVPWGRTNQILKLVFGIDKHRDPETWKAFSPRAHLDVAKVIPPTLLLCGTADPLLGQTRAYARELEQRGAKVRTKIYRGSTHGFMNFWWQRDGQHSLALMHEWLEEHLRRAG